MKPYLTVILSLLLLSGCMKDDNNTSEPTIDWETFGYVMAWTEIESQSGDLDWTKISDGQKLTFFSNSVDEKLGLPNNGKVLYTPKPGINIKNEGSFKRTNNTLIFYYSPFTANADTVTLTYELYDSSTLIISNTTVKPAIKIKYSRDNKK